MLYVRDHFVLQVQNIPHDTMVRFVEWELEREHGDLGLGSACTPKPPPSRLALSLREDESGQVVRNLVQYIASVAYDNIGMTRARLDLVHGWQSIDEFETKHDRLPANIVALFDAGLRHIEKQRETQRVLGLRAISAASHDIIGAPIADILRWLQGPRADPMHFPARSAEDILEAANGFVILTPSNDLAVYHPTFYVFVKQDYNESLYWANSQLQNDVAGRSFTSKPQLQTRKNSLALSEEPQKAALARTLTESIFSAKLHRQLPLL